MSRLEFRAVRVAIGCEDEAGLLAMIDGRLCAVFTRMTAEFHGNARGRWHLEAGFGIFDTRPDSFADLAEVAGWIGRRAGLSAAQVAESIAVIGV